MGTQTKHLLPSEMPHIDFGPLSSVIVVKGRAVLLPDPVPIMGCAKKYYTRHPQTLAKVIRSAWKILGEEQKGKRAIDALQRNLSQQIWWEHKDHYMDSKERVTAEEGKRDLHFTNSVRKGAWDYRETSCVVLSTISIYVPTRLLLTVGYLMLLVSWINHRPKSVPKMPINSLIYCHSMYGIHQMNINAITTMVECF